MVQYDKYMLNLNERKTLSVFLVLILAIAVLSALGILSIYDLFSAILGLGLCLYSIPIVKLTSLEVHSTASKVWIYTLALFVVALVLGGLLSFFVRDYLLVKNISLQIPISIFETIHTSLIIGSSILIAIAGIFGRENKILLRQTIIVAALILFLSLISLEISIFSLSYAFYLLVIINTEFLLVASLFRILYNIISN